MSLSVIIPVKRSSSKTGKAPTLNAFIRWAASSTDASGSMHSTPLVITSLTRMDQVLVLQRSPPEQFIHSSE